MVTVSSILWYCAVASALRFHVDSSGDRENHSHEKPGRAPRALVRRTEPSLTNEAAFGIENTDAEEVDTTSSSPVQSSQSVMNDSIVASNTGGSPSNSGIVATPATLSGYGVPIYSFPSSIVQVAVATICPSDTASNKSTSSNNTDAPPTLRIFGPLANLTSNNTLTNMDNSSHAALPGPNQLGIEDRNTEREARLTSDQSNVARVIMGNNSCQTIYTPTTTAQCNTLLTLAGLAPVYVTDCEQWITFSTASPTTCRSMTPIPIQPIDTTATPIVDSLDEADVVAPTQMPTTTALIDSVQDILYYVAHWWDLATNNVPSIVRVEDCPEGGIGDACPAHTETWQVSSVTSRKSGTSMITYHGPVYFTSGTCTLNTSIAISTVITTTRTITIPTIVRHTLNGTDDTDTTTASSHDGQTVTVSLSVPTTRTWFLETDETSTTTITSRVTVTSIIGAETSTEPVMK